MHEIELKIGVLVFVEGGKPENPVKNPRSKDENQKQTQPTNERRVRNRTHYVIPGPHCRYNLAFR